jgi:light-regulated signal transduction histidine kinase (bacteriophytochrome)
MTPAQKLTSDCNANESEAFVPLTARSLHDLSGPGNQVSAMAGLLVKKYRGRLDEDADKILSLVESSSTRLHLLLQGLSTYLQIAGAPGTRGFCDGATLLAGALTALRGDIERQRARVTHTALPQLYCNPDQVSFVFRSLIENAVRFRRDEAPDIRVSAADQHDAWLFSVADNGIGIAPSHHSRIFGVFSKLRNAGPGAGVGLAIVKRIIEMHGGKVWVESEVDKGSTFCFTLPRHPHSNAA